MFDLSLVSVYRTKREKGLDVRSHKHDYYELVYYISGKGTAEINGVEYSFYPNFFALIPPHEEHNERHEADGELVCLKFFCSDRHKRVLGESSDGRLLDVLKNVLKETARQNVGYRDMIEAKLLEMYVLLLRFSNGNSAGSKSFEYVISYLNENYHERIKLTDCAAQLNLSYDYFQHKFKAITGKSPQRFLLERRLTAAKALMDKEGTNCTETAFRCGFSTSAQFSMLFKREYGITPNKYRK